MTDQQTPADAGQGAPDETRTTEYVVMVVHDLLPPEITNGMAPEVWRELGVISVPLGTKRATVLQRAGELAAPHAMDDQTPARFRVWPLEEQQDGEAALERPEPQLRVTAL